MSCQGHDVLRSSDTITLVCLISGAKGVFVAIVVAAVVYFKDRDS